MKVRNNVEVTTIKTKSEYIGYNRIIIEAPRKNTRLIYVALSYDYNGAIFEDYEPFAPSEAKFYSAPKNKKIHYIKYYSEEGKQYLNFVSSEGSISRTFVHDPEYSEKEWGLIPAHTFSAVDVFEELTSFILAWTDRKIRKYLKVRIKFFNSGASTFTALAKILQDDDWLDIKQIAVPAGASRVLELFCRQPPLFNVHATIKIMARVPNTAVSVVADSADSRWDVERRVATEEFLRAEYSPKLCGVATWTTPTIIPRFTQDEFNRGWNWSTDSSEVPYVEEIGAGAYYLQNKLVLPSKTNVVLLANIHYGHLNWLPAKWGISPQAGADRYIGFDRPTFVDCLGFWIKDTNFFSITRNWGLEEKTTLTWDATYATEFRRYAILWKPMKAEFFINEELVATHVIAPEFPSGLGFRNDDNIAGNLEIASLFELENCAGHFPSGAPIAKTKTWTNPTANSILTLYVHGRKHVEIWAKSIAAGAVVKISASQDGVTWRPIENLTTASFEGVNRAHKAYLNAYQYIKVEIAETGTGTHIIEINASGE